MRQPARRKSQPRIRDENGGGDCLGPLRWWADCYKLDSLRLVFQALNGSAVIGRNIELEVKASVTFRNAFLPSFNQAPRLRNCIAKRFFKMRRVRRTRAGWRKACDNEMRRSVRFPLSSAPHVKMRSISRKKCHANAFAGLKDDLFPFI
jgi:hypothetical protein